MSRMLEYMRWKRAKKKRRLKEYSSVKPLDHNFIRNSKRAWKEFQRVQDQLREMFPGLVKKDKGVIHDGEVRSGKGGSEEHRYDYY